MAIVGVDGGGGGKRADGDCTSEERVSHRVEVVVAGGGRGPSALPPLEAVISPNAYCWNSLQAPHASSNVLHRGEPPSFVHPLSLDFLRLPDACLSSL